MAEFHTCESAELASGIGGSTALVEFHTCARVEFPASGLAGRVAGRASSSSI